MANIKVFEVTITGDTVAHYGTSCAGYADASSYALESFYHEVGDSRAYFVARDTVNKLLDGGIRMAAGVYREGVDVLMTRRYTPA
jgi:hypothetical protein